jgi:hypothetical protein
MKTIIGWFLIIAPFVFICVVIPALISWLAFAISLITG